MLTSALLAKRRNIGSSLSTRPVDAASSTIVPDCRQSHHIGAPPPALDLDATDDPLHGHQEGRFFHGYYDCYCYLPLYIFCGSHLLAAKQRPANIAMPPLAPQSHAGPPKQPRRM